MDKSLRGHYLKTMGVVEYVPKNCEADFDEAEETVIKTGPSYSCLLYTSDAADE